MGEISSDDRLFFITCFLYFGFLSLRTFENWPTIYGGGGEQINSQSLSRCRRQEGNALFSEKK